MSTGTGIEWTNATWNPVVGCTRASRGCDSCYAVKMTHRLEAMGQAKYAGLTVLNPRGERHFNGVVRTDEAALAVPLGWKKPRRVFVNSMSDLFHKDVPFEFVDRVFAVMALTPRHTYQILTKRPERMAEYLETIRKQGDGVDLTGREPGNWTPRRIWRQAWMTSQKAARDAFPGGSGEGRWPLPNVWLGASVEDQDAAALRVPPLIRCPTPVRWLSIEPLLSPIDLTRVRWDLHYGWEHRQHRNCLDSRVSDIAKAAGIPKLNSIDWVVVGCESKPGKALGRFADGYAAAAQGVIEQCRAAGVPVFHKQMPIDGRACGDAEKFPERMRVREFPA